MASASRDRLIHIYDIEKDFDLFTTLDDHTSSITSLKFAYNNTEKKLYLISCGVDKSLFFRVFEKESD